MSESIEWVISTEGCINVNYKDVIKGEIVIEKKSQIGDQILLPISYKESVEENKNENDLLPNELIEINLSPQMVLNQSDKYIIYSSDWFYNRFKIIQRNTETKIDFFRMAIKFPTQIKHLHLRGSQAIFISGSYLFLINLSNNFNEISSKIKNESPEVALKYQVFYFDNELVDGYISSGILYVILKDYLVIINPNMEIESYRVDQQFKRVIVYGSQVFLITNASLCILQQDFTVRKLYNFSCVGFRDAKMYEADGVIAIITKSSLHFYRIFEDEFFSHYKPVNFSNNSFISFNSSYICFYDRANGFYLLDKKTLEIVKSMLVDYNTSKIFVNKFNEIVLFSKDTIEFIYENEIPEIDHKETDKSIKNISFEDLLADDDICFLNQSKESNEVITLEGVDQEIEYIKKEDKKVNNEKEHLMNSVKCKGVILNKSQIKVNNFEGGKYKISVNINPKPVYPTNTHLGFFTRNFYDWFEGNYNYNINRKKEETEEGEFPLYDQLFKKRK